MKSALLACVLLADGGTAGRLTVTVADLRSAKGQVGCTLYAGPKGYPTDAAAAFGRTWCPIVGSQAKCAFEGVGAGDYAVACFHDENGNSQLDKGMFGIPSEGTAASNNAKGFMGPPKYEDAKFRHGGGDEGIDVKVRY
jgi:uncharacterized protein (DUF2141 family)